MKLAVVVSKLRHIKPVQVVVTLTLVISLAISAFPVQVVQAAATLYVAPGAGIAACTQADPCHISYALNIYSAGDTIQMAPGTYYGYHTITQGVTIQGPAVAPGADPLVIMDGTISPGSSGRVLDIGMGISADVYLNYITIQNGKAAGSGGGVRCATAQGAVVNLSLNGVVVRQNAAMGDPILTHGGGIHTSKCNLTVRNSQIVGNTAAGYGGGIFVEYSPAPVSIEDSTITNNTATSYFGGGITIGNSTAANLSRVTISGNHSTRGGGIYAGADNLHPVNIAESSIHGNTSTNYGGGIYTFREMNLTNVTISSNNAASYGGGIFGDVSTNYIATLNLNHCTLAGNSVTLTWGNGTGIYLEPTASLHARNTIFAGPAGKAVCAGATDSLSSVERNISSDDSCHLLGDILGNGDLANTDPLLGPLQDNGGPTLTHALLPGSPAINHARPSSTTHDQRGFAYNGLPDVGAFELWHMVYLPGVIR